MENSHFKSAVWYAQHGWKIFPLRPGTKEPFAGIGVYHATTDLAQIKKWWTQWPSANIGLNCGNSGLIALDADQYKDIYDGDKLLDKDQEETVTNLTGGGGTHLLYLMPEGKLYGNATKGLPSGIDVRGFGGYIVLPPSTHPTGNLYAWESGYGPHEIVPLPLPDFLCEIFDAAQVTAAADVIFQETTTQKPDLSNWQLSSGILDLVNEGAAKGGRSESDQSVITALVGSGATDTEILSVFQHYPIGTRGKFAEKGSQALPYLELSIGKARSFLDEARRMEATNGLNGTANGNGNGNGNGRENVDEGGIAEADKERFTDLGNARRFARIHGQDFRFTLQWGWQTWTGKHWTPDKTGAVMRRAKETATSYYTEAAQITRRAATFLRLAGESNTTADQRDKITETAEDLSRTADAMVKWAKVCQSRARIEAITRLAESELPIATTVDVFDRGKWTLNANNGTIDLKTGQLHPHNREDMITALSPFDYDPNAQCPAWLTFLDQIMGGNQNMVEFLRRMVGYSLTGDVSEQVLFFLYGSGANGKSTFVNMLLSLLGEDYAIQAAPELLVVGKDRHPTEVADLYSKRLVASIEVEDGKRLAEGLVKQLTGGDKLKARLMRQDFFQFDPTHKLFLVANHKPIVRGTDYAIWRRIKLVPFDVTIAPENRDPHLLEKLTAEAPGILAWAVRGCMEWQKIGLDTPDSVTSATNAYQAESDTLSSFIKECLVMVDVAETKASDLYGSYNTWCEDNGERAMSGTLFGRKLVERGFDKYQKRTGTFYIGVGIVS